MTLLVLTLAGFALTMLALALGVLLTGRRLKGSCGGLASAGECLCKRDGITPNRCPRRGSSSTGGERRASSPDAQEIPMRL